MRSFFFVSLSTVFLLPLTSLLVLGACGSGGDHPPVSSEPCSPNCTVTGDAWVPPLGDADVWKGDRGTVTGTVSYSDSPEFPYFPTSNFLPYPARVHFPFARFDYTTESSPATGFTLKDVPLGESIVMLEDIDGQNGILNTVMKATVSDKVIWTLPGVRVETLNSIYAANGLTRKPDKAQVILTLLSSPLGGGFTPIAGAQIDLFQRAEALLVDVPDGKFAVGTTTGALGTVIFANVRAAAYPGEMVGFSYAYGPRHNDKLKFVVVAGAVTRAPVQDSSN